MNHDPEVIVLGSGPNGLKVLVLEANSEFGGAVRTAEATLPGFRHDLCSGFYPLFPVGPIGRLPLHQHGLEWVSFERPFGGGTPDGPGVTLAPTAEESAVAFGRNDPRDAQGFSELWGWWSWGGKMLLDLLYNPIGTPRPLLNIGRRLTRPRKLLEFAQLTVASARRVAEDYFQSEDAHIWFIGSALHSDLSPEAPGGGAFSLSFLGLGQRFGMPIPRGGAASITSSLLSYLEHLGGRALSGERAEQLIVRNGRVAAVRTKTNELRASRGVLATVEPQQLFLKLVGEQHLPEDFVRKVGAYRWSVATIKIDLALSGLPQFKAEPLQRTGVLHLADSTDALSLGMHAAGRGYLPTHPLLVAGIHTLADPTRAPEGQHTFWAESHVPYSIKGDEAGTIHEKTWPEVKERYADRMVDELERFAPGTKALVIGRYVQSPVDLESGNSNLVRGDIAGGSFDITQQLVFRPIPGWFYHRTPVKGLYMGGASTHPGGGVNGAAGANAARVMLADLKVSRLKDRFPSLFGRESG